MSELIIVSTSSRSLTTLNKQTSFTILLAIQRFQSDYYFTEQTEDRFRHALKSAKMHHPDVEQQNK